VSSWNGKTKGGLTGYKFFVFILKHLGLSFTYFILSFVAFYYFIFYFKSFRNIFFLYHKIFKFSFVRSVCMIYKNYFVFGQVLLDKVAMLAGFHNKFSFDFEGEEHLIKMSENKTGGLLISAHIGNFEIAGQLLKRIKAKINIVMLESEHLKIKDYLSDIYIENNVNVISIKNDYSHIFEISKAFENKEIVCIHGDRFLKGSKTVTSLFFEKDAEFPSGPFYLATKFNIPVSYVFAMKEKKFHYHFYASEPEYYYLPQLNLKKRENSIRKMVNDYICNLEQYVKKYPAQWFNFYNFWKAK